MKKTYRLRYLCAYFFDYRRLQLDNEKGLGKTDMGEGFQVQRKSVKNVSENENITFRVLDGKEISVSRDS